jgi:conserved hypothetical protein (putative transposase or invertase)
MTQTKTTTPHDAVFKAFMTHTETARDFLEIHLPAPLLSLCDLTTLRLESGSFIDEELRSSHSDVLWSVSTPQGPGYIYALIEHQSSADKHMMFRLMNYAFAVMRRYLSDWNKPLPLVIPILFYHGERSPYPYSMCWLDEFAHPQAARELYCGALPLVDITVLPDSEIAAHKRVAILEFLQKNIRRRDLLELTEMLAALFSPGYTTQSQFDALVSYMAQAGHSAQLATFFRQLARRIPQHKETLMTLAEWMKVQEQEWKKEGLREAALKIAQAMMACGVEIAIITKTTGLSLSELDELTH